MKKERLPRGQRLILWGTWALEASAILPLTLSLLPTSNQPWQHWPVVSSLLMLIGAPLAVMWWLVVGLAEIYYLPVGISVCAVILCPNVRPLTKVLTGIAGILAIASAIHLFHTRQM